MFGTDDDNKLLSQMCLCVVIPLLFPSCVMFVKIPRKFILDSYVILQKN